MKAKGKLWGGVFQEPPDELAWEFGKSIDTDAELWQEEIAVTLAHVTMLRDQKLLDAGDAHSLMEKLKRMEQDYEWVSGEAFRNSEDIHAAVEQHLSECVGEAAKRFTAGRSRNDQIATVTRLWVMRRCERIRSEVSALQNTFLHLAKKYAGEPMTGYTHQQPAQPITLGYHLLAYFWMLQRDGNRFGMVSEMASSCPLGSCALAGTSLPLNREQTAADLGFKKPAPSALDAVSDRDFVGDALHASATLLQHLSRLCQELILWSSAEWRFVSIGEAYTTGSSLMPQKRNPDVAELIRGRAARAIGNWTAFMATMKALPLAYNRDMQDDKPPLFDSVQLSLRSLPLVRGMLESCRFDIARMREAALTGFSTATDLAEALTAGGTPFRTAHKMVGKVVRECEKNGWTLHELTPERLRALLPEITPEAMRVLSLDGSIASRNVVGGTSPKAIEAQIRAAEDIHARGFERPF